MCIVYNDNKQRICITLTITFYWPLLVCYLSIVVNESPLGCTYCYYNNERVKLSHRSGKTEKKKILVGKKCSEYYARHLIKHNKSFWDALNFFNRLPSAPMNSANNYSYNVINSCDDTVFVVDYSCDYNKYFTVSDYKPICVQSHIVPWFLSESRKDASPMISFGLMPFLRQ